jgi:hypothetical protein
LVKRKIGMGSLSLRAKKKAEGRRGKGISQKEGNQKHAAASFDCLVNLDGSIRFTEGRAESEENKKEKDKSRELLGIPSCCFDLF